MGSATASWHGTVDDGEASLTPSGSTVENVAIQDSRGLIGSSLVGVVVGVSA
jgi:hypothetical protein